MTAIYTQFLTSRIGATVVAADGAELGTLGAVVVDLEDAGAVWLVVALDGLRTRRALVSPDGVEFTRAGTVVLPHGEKAVRKAPTVHADRILHQRPSERQPVVQYFGTPVTRGAARTKWEARYGMAVVATEHELDDVRDGTRADDFLARQAARTAGRDAPLGAESQGAARMLARRARRGAEATLPAGISTGLVLAGERR